MCQEAFLKSFYQNKVRLLQSYVVLWRDLYWAENSLGYLVTYCTVGHDCELLYYIFVHRKKFLNFITAFLSTFKKSLYIFLFCIFQCNFKRRATFTHWPCCLRLSIFARSKIVRIYQCKMGNRNSWRWHYLNLFDRRVKYGIHWPAPTLCWPNSWHSNGQLDLYPLHA